MAKTSDEEDLTCADFDATLERLRGEGARLDVIWPADAPHTALLTHEGKRVRLTARPDAPPLPAGLPAFRPEFVLTRAGGEPGAGRAGMAYRDLIPGRLGGHTIASHITIPDGGPVADWVHYHRIALQLIVVRRGRVRVVYEDQGAPFVMAPGDMVLQPPGIRHRVLEASPGLEVVEISCPAAHETFADHALELPNGPARPGRTWDGQIFLHHEAAGTPWTPWHGGEVQPTQLGEATGGSAEARVLRPGAAPAIAVPAHDGELVFGFILEGTARLEFGDGHKLGPADAFVIPPGAAWRLTDLSADFRLLHVTTRTLEQGAPDRLD
jgi:quercetin dioxygenase-like cupin family protein